MFIVIQGSPENRAGDTIVLDSVAGHRKTFGTLTAFLATRERTVEIGTLGACHLCPGWPTLRAFRVVKTSDNLRTEEQADGVLQVSGRPELLARYIEAFRFDPGEEEHRHPEQAVAAGGGGLDPRSATIIIEADDYADDPERWAADNRG